MTTGEESAPQERAGDGRPMLLLAGGVLLTAAGGATVLSADPILGAFIAIFGATLLVIGILARNWNGSPTYEEREHARARRRKEKWERGSAARERDRARWEAYQQRQAGNAER